jgi:hypothetical protein
MWQWRCSEWLKRLMNCRLLYVVSKYRFVVHNDALPDNEDLHCGDVRRCRSYHRALYIRARVTSILTNLTLGGHLAPYGDPNETYRSIAVSIAAANVTKYRLNGSRNIKRHQKRQAFEHVCKTASVQEPELGMNVVEGSCVFIKLPTARMLSLRSMLYKVQGGSLKRRSKAAFRSPRWLRTT